MVSFRDIGNGERISVLTEDDISPKWRLGKGTDLSGRSFSLRGKVVVGASNSSRSLRANAALRGSASPYTRAAIVKIKGYTKMGRRTGSIAATLLNYMEKDGSLFGREEGVEIDRNAIAEAWKHDRYTLHMIVSPNDGGMLSTDEMKEFARDTIDRWERRLGPLEWVASVEEKPDMAHPDGNKHLHVAVRGVQDNNDLVLHPDVFRDQPLRRDAMEAMTDRLGYMTEREADALDRQKQEMSARREEARGVELDRTEVERSMEVAMRQYEEDRGIELDRNTEFWEGEQ